MHKKTISLLRATLLYTTKAGKPTSISIIKTNQ